MKVRLFIDKQNRKRRLQSLKVQWIYFIQAGEYVKIGFTRKDDISNRLAALQIGNPLKLKLLSAFPSCQAPGDEATLHKLFHAFRASGEWFKLPKNILSHVRLCETISEICYYKPQTDRPASDKTGVDRLGPHSRPTPQGAPVVQLHDNNNTRTSGREYSTATTAKRPTSLENALASQTA